MPNILSISNDEKMALAALGKALRTQRKRRGDNQADAADRIGVSRETYRLMERGTSGTAIGHWIRAIRLYGNLHQLEALFPVSLFDQLPGV